MNEPLRQRQRHDFRSWSCSMIWEFPSVPSFGHILSWECFVAWQKTPWWSRWMKKMVVMMVMGLWGSLSFIDHYCLLLRIYRIWFLRLCSLISSKKSSPPLNTSSLQSALAGWNLRGFSLFAVAWGINSKELNEIRSAASGDNDTSSEDRANGSQRPLEHRGFGRLKWEVFGWAKKGW